MINSILDALSNSRSKFLPTASGGDFLHFGPTAESASHCFYDICKISISMKNGKSQILNKIRNAWKMECTKSESEGIGSGECFAPICAHVSRRHVHSVISLCWQRRNPKGNIGSWSSMGAKFSKIIFFTKSEH